MCSGRQIPGTVVRNGKKWDLVIGLDYLKNQAYKNKELLMKQSIESGLISEEKKGLRTCDEFINTNVPIIIEDSNEDGKITIDEIKYRPMIFHGCKLTDNDSIRPLTTLGKSKPINEAPDAIRSLFKYHYKMDISRFEIGVDTKIVEKALLIFVSHESYGFRKFLNACTADDLKTIVKDSADAAAKIGISPKDAKEKLLTKTMKWLYDIRNDKKEFISLKTKVLKAFHLTKKEFNTRLKRARHGHWLC